MKLSNSINTLTLILSKINLRQYSDIRIIFFRHYEEEINNLCEIYSKQISEFDKNEFMNSLEIEHLPKMLGLDLKDFILRIVNYIPNLLITYDTENNIFNLTEL